MVLYSSKEHLNKARENFINELTRSQEHFLILNTKSFENILIVAKYKLYLIYL